MEKKRFLADWPYKHVFIANEYNTILFVIEDWKNEIDSEWIT